MLAYHHSRDSPSEIVQMAPSKSLIMLTSGGEGTVTLKVSLKGYKGNVKKTATVECNDPESPRTSLTMQGKVKTVIDVRPANTVSFRGKADKVGTSTIELVGAVHPFRITKVDIRILHRRATS